jgi:hypothetical protein
MTEWLIAIYRQKRKEIKTCWLRDLRCGRFFQEFTFFHVSLFLVSISAVVKKCSITILRFGLNEGEKFREIRRLSIRFHDDDSQIILQIIDIFNESIISF